MASKLNLLYFKLADGTWRGLRAKQSTFEQMSKFTAFLGVTSIYVEGEHGIETVMPKELVSRIEIFNF